MPTTSRKQSARDANAPKGTSATTMDRYMEDKGPGPEKKDSSSKRTHEVTSDVMSDPKSNDTDCYDGQDLRSFITEVSQKQTEEICAKIEGVKTRVTNLENSVEFNSARIEDLKQKADLYDSTVKELTNLRERVLLSEIYSRKSNLLIYGIPKTKDSDLTRATKDIFSHILKIDPDIVADMRYVNIHRLPAMHKKTERPDPVIIKFVSQTDRDMVLNAKFKCFKDLSRENIVFRTDLPPELKQRRSKLEAKAYAIRKEQKYQTRIFERGFTVTLQYRATKDNPWKPLELNESITDE